MVEHPDHRMVITAQQRDMQRGRTKLLQNGRVQPPLMQNRLILRLVQQHKHSIRPAALLMPGLAQRDDMAVPDAKESGHAALLPHGASVASPEMKWRNCGRLKSAIQKKRPPAKRTAFL